VNAKEREAWLRRARRNGCRVVNGKKHIKVYAADGRYLVSIGHGRGTSTAKSDEAYRIARREGWTD
jgi:hypothetical protein